MGADGGVVYIRLKNPTSENFNRVHELLLPFWEFLTCDGRSSWAEESTSEWECNNHLGSDYILGYYGTDRCDSFDLSDLEWVCDLSEVDDNWQGHLWDLSFDAIDLDCRTNPTPITGKKYEPIPYQLWHHHCDFFSREETLKRFEKIVSMTTRQWATELQSLLHLDRYIREETWT